LQDCWVFEGKHDKTGHQGIGKRNGDLARTMIRDFAETGSHGCKESIRILVLTQHDFIVADDFFFPCFHKCFSII